MRFRSIRSALSVVTLVVSPLAGWAQRYPAQPIELIPAGDPGGGLDLHARLIEKAFQEEKLADKPFTIVNKGAGGGNAATAYMVTQKGSGYHLAINTNRVLLNPLMGTTKQTIADMTPVVRLTAEYEAWVVRADSKYKSALEVLEDLKKNPKAAAFGIGTAPPATDYLNVVLPVRAKGLDPTKINVVAFRGAGDVATQLLGGHIALGSSSLSELVPQIEAGKLRVLVISAPKRLGRFKDVPTWQELGLDVVLAHWRGIFGPPGMPKEAYEYWNKKFAQMVSTKAWKEILAKNELMDAFMPGDQFKTDLEADNVLLESLLGNLGMLEKK